MAIELPTTISHLFHPLRIHILLRPFNSGTFVVEALNKTAFLIIKGSECAIVDTALSTRYPPPSPPPRVVTYAYHELAYEFILTATIFCPQSKPFSGVGRQICTCKRHQNMKLFAPWLELSIAYQRLGTWVRSCFT